MTPNEPAAASDQVRRAIATLLRELIDGPGDTGYMLNPGDPGLLASLDRLSAADASARPDGRPSVASHVDHLRYGFELLNRSLRHDDPWPDADWSQSWQRQSVDEAAWTALRAALGGETRALKEAASRLASLDDLALTTVIGSIAHLAYHLGAIRQVARQAAGPPQRG